MSFGRTLEILGWSGDKSRQYTLKSADLGCNTLTINVVLPDGKTWDETEPKIFAMVAAGFGINGGDLLDEVTIIRHGTASDAPHGPDAATARFATV